MAIASGLHRYDADLVQSVSIFERVGLVVPVDEDHLDALAGLSGSGPPIWFA